MWPLALQRAGNAAHPLATCSICNAADAHPCPPCPCPCPCPPCPPRPTLLSHCSYSRAIMGFSWLRRMVERSSRLYIAAWRCARMPLSVLRGWPPPPMQPPGQAMTLVGGAGGRLRHQEAVRQAAEACLARWGDSTTDGPDAAGGAACVTLLSRFCQHPSPLASLGDRPGRARLAAVTPCQAPCPSLACPPTSIKS